MYASPIPQPLRKEETPASEFPEGLEPEAFAVLASATPGFPDLSVFVVATFGASAATFVLRVDSFPVEVAGLVSLVISRTFSELGLGATVLGCRAVIEALLEVGALLTTEGCMGVLLACPGDLHQRIASLAE